MKLPIAENETYAVLVIDMQKDGLDPGGAIFADGGYEITQNISSITSLARERGWPVLHSQHVHRTDLSDFGIAGHFEPPSCIEGSEGMEFVPEMTPAPGDIVVQKRRYSAFHGTDLELILRGLGVSGIIVSGVLTDACVLSTVVDARSRDFKVWLVADALSGTTPELHDAALRIFEGYFADVVTTEWAKTAIEGHSNPVRPTEVKRFQPSSDSAR